MIIEGKISVKAALLGNKRTVSKVWVDQAHHDKEARFIIAKAHERNVEVIRCAREKIDEMASGRTHGGYLAEAGERTMDSIEPSLEKENPFLVLLEGVEDPFNLGYIMRSLYSAGCDGLVIRQRNWHEAESVILKSSAGASEYLNVIMMEPEKAVTICREKGLYVYAAMRRDAQPYFEADFRRPILLCIGGEMRGLSAEVLKNADQNIYIPYANDFRNALNAAGACAALGFEVLRQRQYSNVVTD